MKFLKPTVLRVTVFLFLVVLIKLVPIKGSFICPFAPPCYETTNFIPLWKLLFVDNPEMQFSAIPFSLIYLLIIYLLIVPIPISLTSKIWKSKGLIQFSIWRTLFFVLGWLSAMSVLLQILQQQRTGHFLWLISEYLVLILFPFALLSQGLHYFNAFFLQLIFRQFDIVINIPLDYTDKFTSLDLVVMLLLLTFEWLLVSYWIILGFRKIKNQFIRKSSRTDLGSVD